MDNRTGFRRRGNAYLAEQARQALGLVAAPPQLAELPAPLVHTAFGAAVCGLLLAFRPDLVGLRAGAIVAGCLAVVTAAALAGYDRIVYPASHRPPLDAVVLPVAAVIAFATVLAGVSQLGLRVAAGVIAALVIGGIPQMLWRQTAAGRRRFGLLRDVAGVVVLAPVLVAGVSGLLPPGARLALVTLAVLLVSYDGLRNEPLSPARAAAGAVLTACALGAAAALAGHSVTPGACAALLLVLWYGVRGMAASLAVTERRDFLALAEHAAFTGVAAGALRLVLVSQ